MQRRAGRVLHAMLRPKGLVAIMKALGVEGLRAFVARRERGVARGMPVLRDDNTLESARQPIDERNDLVALLDRQRPARHEIGLQVDREKDVLVIDGNCRGHRDRSSHIMGAALHSGVRTLQREPNHA